MRKSPRGAVTHGPALPGLCRPLRCRADAQDVAAPTRDSSGPPVPGTSPAGRGVGLRLTSRQARPLCGAQLAGDRQAFVFLDYTATVTVRVSGDHSTPDGRPPSRGVSLSSHRPPSPVRLTVQRHEFLGAGFPRGRSVAWCWWSVSFPSLMCKEGSGPPLGARSMPDKGITS